VRQCFFENESIGQMAVAYFRKSCHRNAAVLMSAIRPIMRSGQAIPAVSNNWDARGLCTSPRQLVVQKFGGTSLGGIDKLEKVHGIVNQWHTTQNKQVVAVVSAMSSTVKIDGTTSRLLAAADCAINQRCFMEDVNKIEDIHMTIVYGSIENAAIRDEVRSAVMGELRHLRRFLESLTVIRELSGRSMDQIVGCGERLSAHLTAAVLRGRGLPAVAVDLSNLVEHVDTKSAGYQEGLIEALRVKLSPILEDQSPSIPIVTGFFGHVHGGIVEGVGRGYTDLTAALTAAAFNAEALQVWKESDGVFTGNPTKIDTARLVGMVSPKEAAELTYFGNEVLHPYTMEAAMSAQVPVHILNTFKPDGHGTVVDPAFDYNARCEQLEKDGTSHGAVTAICSKSNVMVLNLMSNRKLGSFKFLASVFDVLLRYEVKVDLVTTTEVSLSVTVNESTPKENVLRAVEELSSVGACQLKEDRAIVSIIGEGMKRHVGVASQMFAALADAGINIEMIAQGSSEVNISAVVDCNDANRAIHTIHKAFVDDVASK